MVYIYLLREDIESQIIYILKKVLLVPVFCVDSIVLSCPIFFSFSRWTALTYFRIYTLNLLEISISCSNLLMYCLIKSIVDKRSIYETIPTKQNKCVLFDACDVTYLLILLLTIINCISNVLITIDTCSLIILLLLYSDFTIL